MKKLFRTKFKYFFEKSFLKLNNGKKKLALEWMKRRYFINTLFSVKFSVFENILTIFKLGKFSNIDALKDHFT